MTIETIKFSEFFDGGDLEPNQTTVGLDNTNTVNTRFSNQFPLLAPGTTAERPAIAPEMYYRLRFNTTLELYEYYSPTAADWIQLQVGADILPLLASHLPGLGASLIGLENQGPVLNKFVQDLANAALIAQTDNGTLVNGVFLSALSTGVLGVTTGTGALASRVLTGTANQINIANGDGSANPTFSVSSTLDLPGTLTIQGSTIIDEIIDDDTMATATATNISTSEAIKAYVDSQIGGSGTVNAGTANQIAYYAANGDTISGLTGANSAQLVTNSTGVPAMTASLTDGQIVIGVTGGTPTPGTLTAGPGISIAEGAGSITISGTGSGIGWTEVTGTTQAMASDNGYASNNVSQVVFTLPATAAFGTILNVVGKGAGGWQIAQNAGQNIQVGSVSTTVGAGGTLTSTNQFDAIELVCTTADTVWTALSVQGNIDYV